MSMHRRKLSNNHNFYSARRTGEGVALSYIGSDWMVDKYIYEPRELEFLDYQEDVTARYEQFKASLASENITTMDSARQAGVQNEWETLNFFAQDEVNAPRDLFMYINDEGVPSYFTSLEIDAIKNWKPGEPAPIKDMEMHHMELVSHNPDNISLAATPDNILAATTNGHREHLHGGNTQNATNPEYFEYSLTTDQQFERTIAYNQDEITLNALEVGAYSIGTSVAVYNMIALGIESYRLKDDPRPWSEKRRMLLHTSVATTVFGLGLSTVGYATRLSVDSLFSGFSLPVLETAFTEIIALNSSFLAVSAIGGVLKYIWDVRNGRSKEEAAAELKSILMVATAEFLAFQALGIGLEMLADFAGETVLDALIPDPTGIFIAARVGYSLFKLGKKVWDANENKKSVKDCMEKRFTFLFEQAKKWLDDGDGPQGSLVPR